MLRTYIYVPEELDLKLIETARAQKISKASVIRKALDEGLKTMQGDTDASIQFLFKVAELGKKYQVKGPKNSSQRIDELMWSKDWTKDE